MSVERTAEFSKYVRAYNTDHYRMGRGRKDDAMRNLKELSRGSYLDVSCGRGEMVTYAESIGFSPVKGTEIVPKLIDGERVVYTEAHLLPFEDQSWDVVTFFDVIEHLIPGDDEAACREMLRVARKHILLTANSKESKLKDDGTVLHINRRPEEEWDGLFHQWFGSAAVILRCEVGYTNSPMWRVDVFQGRNTRQ